MVKTCTSGTYFCTPIWLHHFSSDLSSSSSLMKYFCASVSSVQLISVPHLLLFGVRLGSGCEELLTFLAVPLFLETLPLMKTLFCYLTLQTYIAMVQD